MESYRELMQVVERVAAEVFSAATTEEDVCKLEQEIYDEINRVAAAKIADLS
jgi:transcriptional regulator with GAF, ATPase, and Fis domain